MGLMPLTDSGFLDVEGRERPMHVGSLALFTPPTGAGPAFAGDLYRRAMATQEVSRRLRMKPVRKGGVGPWEWQEDDAIDLEYHVRHSALPHPGRVRELLALAGRLHGTLLHRSRPLWESNVIEGLEDGRFAVYTKMHHALVDGVTGMKLLQRSLSTDPDERDLPAPWARMDPPARTADPGEPKGRPNPLRAVSGAVSGVASGVREGVRAVTGSSEAAVRTLWRSFSEEASRMPFQAPRTMFNVPISGARRFAADGYAMDRIRAVRDATGATLNDVVMAMSAGALRRYLLDLDALPDDPLIAAVPVSLHGEGSGDGNNVGIVLCNLGTHLARPEERLELVRESMDRGKLTLKGLNQLGTLMLSAMNFVPAGLGALPFDLDALRRPAFNVLISNVPGPRQPLYFSGARLDGLYPMSIPTDGLALNITVTTYDGELQVGLTGCRRTVPHLQRLLTHLDDSLAELEAIGG